MLDFLDVDVNTSKTGMITIKPDFDTVKRSDVMTKGKDFYAIWYEDLGIWSTDEEDATKIIDNYLMEYAKELKQKNPDTYVKIQKMSKSSTRIINNWHNYCKYDLRDKFHPLDQKLVFASDKPTRKDYVSNKRLDYDLIPCDTPNYNLLMDTLYDPEEKHKIEWAIGSIVTGDSKKLQKFLVLYGDKGTGKSTVLNIIQQLFDGYYTVFDAKSLGDKNNQFKLEPFKNHPLVAIQHDGDLSKIEDNTTLNSLISHEQMPINEKNRSIYVSRFNCMLFMGTNSPVKITDAKSGILRRLIDVNPSGRKLSLADYRKVTKGIEFELGGIACHCRDVFLADKDYYDNYQPENMMEATNDFYNFILDSYFVFSDADSTSLKQAWEMYKQYCEMANIKYPLNMRQFADELKAYFNNYDARGVLVNGERVRSFYSGFKKNIFKNEETKSIKAIDNFLNFKEQHSLLDDELKDCLAQYAGDNDIPKYKWVNVKTTLTDIDTKELHYVKVPENHIVIDFDIPDQNGKKDFEANLKAASKWPATYAELSKSGSGIHLHYIYQGDPQNLNRVYDDFIEIKVFSGNSSLRRKLTKCNDIPIANISSGLPMKGDKRKMVNFDTIKSEKALRALIKRNLNKEIHASTKPSVDFIYKILEDAYTGGLKYDVTDMRNAILTFAASSTHQSEYCVKLVSKMHFRSEDASDGMSNDDAKLVFYDVEIFPNLYLINWKIAEDYKPEDFKSWADYIHELQTNHKPVLRMINPSPQEVEDLMQNRLVGFNCRRYDNHTLYARMMGYTNQQLYDLSQKIVSGDKNAFFKEAYNVSYTDVYDFATEKKSLKKFEIELGIHHKELGMPWDQPVPEDKWQLVAEYCDNDVIATEAVFNARKGDFIARQIQVELVKNLHGITNVSVNDTTNSLSGKILFGNNRNPQTQFNYRDLSKPVGVDQYDIYREKFGSDYEFRIFDENGLPRYAKYDGNGELPKGWSILPFFPGYKFDAGKSTYLDQEIGEGGRVYSEPGMYVDIWDGDVASMHPHSAIYECIFGPEYTKRFEEIVEARVAIKHKDFDAAAGMLNGCLKPFLNDANAVDLAQALKIMINSVYGLTSAKFANLFKDPRNIDNIVAKRGALFMTLLKDQVIKQGYQVAHIKTDSIKIPNADKKIIDFVVKFGKEYGYSFETEGEFDRFVLLNDAVYAAKEKGKDWAPYKDSLCKGKQFQIPYVYKKIFSKEPIEFEDLCVTQETQTSLYLNLHDGTDEEKDYRFIGRVGSFCPMKPANGAGILLRQEKDGRYSAATGTKGYLWMEAEIVKSLNLEDKIDRSYFDEMVNNMINDISQLGDAEWFTGSNEHLLEAKISSEPLTPGWKEIIQSDPLPESFEELKEK